MKAEDQKENKVQNSQTIDKVRRSFSRAGVFAPVLLTLNSKTALGSTYQCVISGMQSGNVSGQSEDMSVCASGYTAAEWANVDNVDNSSTSPSTLNIYDWITAGVVPFRVLKKKQGSNFSYQYKKNNACASSPLMTNQINMCIQIFNSFSAGGTLNSAECGLSGTIVQNTLSFIEATTFGTVFGTSDTDSIWTKLSGSGLEYDASVNYLNAKLGLISDISPQEIIALYHLAKNGTPFMDGSLSVTNQAGAIELLASLHP